MQRAWQVWAKQLNDCPPVGVVSQRPRLLLIRMSNQQLLLNDIEHNWSRFRRSMNSGVRSARRTKESNRVSCVGIEKVKRSHQMYKGLYLIPSLIQSIFGYKFKAVKNNIVYETPRTTILHFWGSEKLKDVFSFANESTTEFRNLEYSYSLSRKVYFKNIITRK